jgi:toxin ParE1/3/4
MNAEGPWTVRLTASAEADFQNIIAWTLQEFGDRQASIYGDTLTSAITALLGGPTIVGVKHRQEISKALFTLHVARDGRRGRHFVLLRVNSGARRIEILRVLHDSMDLDRHTSST